MTSPYTTQTSIFSIHAVCSKSDDQHPSSKSDVVDLRARAFFTGTPRPPPWHFSPRCDRGGPASVSGSLKQDFRRIVRDDLDAGSVRRDHVRPPVGHQEGEWAFLRPSVIANTERRLTLPAARLAGRSPQFEQGSLVKHSEGADEHEANAIEGVVLGCRVGRVGQIDAYEKHQHRVVRRLEEGATRPARSVFFLPPRPPTPSNFGQVHDNVFEGSLPSAELEFAVSRPWRAHPPDTSPPGCCVEPLIDAGDSNA